MTTTRLYEDNAGQLTVTHEGKVYCDFEYLQDGTTFSDFGRILQGIAIGDEDRFLSELPLDRVASDEELVATWSQVDGLEVVGQLGLAGQRFVGLDKEVEWR